MILEVFGQNVRLNQLFLLFFVFFSFQKLLSVSQTVSYVEEYYFYSLGLHLLFVLSRNIAFAFCSVSLCPVFLFWLQWLFSTICQFIYPFHICVWCNLVVGLLFVFFRVVLKGVWECRHSNQHKQATLIKGHLSLQHLFSIYLSQVFLLTKRSHVWSRLCKEVHLLFRRFLTEMDPQKVLLQGQPWSSL